MCKTFVRTPDNAIKSFLNLERLLVLPLFWIESLTPNFEKICFTSFKESPLKMKNYYYFHVKTIFIKVLS